jgi:hypothetical protein
MVEMTREKYRQNMIRMANEAFENHLIADRREGRWFLARPTVAGWDDQRKRWDWCFATEIIADLWGGGLYVGGDIDHVIFRSYPGSPEARVRWMGGRSGGQDSYFVEKAIIGTGRELIEQYQGDIAHADLTALQKEITEDVDRPLGKTFTDTVEAIEDIKRCRFDMNRDEVIRDLLATGYFDSERIYDTGMVITPRVFYAHAALRRLCDLLDQEEEKKRTA